MLHNTKMILAFFYLMIVLPFTANAKDATYEFYGAVKASINYTDDGTATATGISSNSTRIGWKGKQDLEGGLQAFFQIEGEIDIGERSRDEFARRDSYVGIKGGFGNVLIGQHETPVEKVRKALFGDTIADSRTLIGVQTGTSVATTDEGASSKIDDRVTNAIGYKTPKFGGIQVFLFHSFAAGAEEEETGNDDNDYDFSSANIVYQTNTIFVGLGSQVKSNGPGAEDLKATRFAANFKLGSLKLGGIYDTVDKGVGDRMTRDAILLFGQYSISEGTKVGLQVSQVDDYDTSSDTGASNISLGVEIKLAKPTTVYALYSSTDNGQNARFGLAQNGVGDKIQASDTGKDVSGLSIGMVHKF